MPTTARRFRLIEITPGGLTGHYAPGTRALASHCALDEFLADLEEDGVVLDSREAIDGEFGLVLRSPYVDPYLEPGIVTNAHGLPRDALGAVARGFWGPDAEVMMESTPTFPFTGFDTVALDLYVAFWQAHGARVARQSNGALVWANQPSPSVVL